MAPGLYRLARSALFALDAEHAHELTLAVFRRFPLVTTAPFTATAVDDPVEMMGLRFVNRVGLAAGLDKNGDCLAAWSRLGFGFVEIGTVTPRPQTGNPRPRMFRLLRKQALINRLGFNNKGVDYLVARVRESGYRGVLGINIGKNFDTPNERAADDYLACLRKVYTLASYIVVNVSSPNTKGLRDLQGHEALSQLLGKLIGESRRLEEKAGKRVPMLLKIAPDLSDEQIRDVAMVAREKGMAGLIATNTTVSRAGLHGESAASQAGGLSGAPLRPLAQQVMAKLRSAVGPDFPLIGVGGIMSGADAQERVQAGANLVQIYTGFIYRGPELVSECSTALRQRTRGVAGGGGFK